MNITEFGNNITSWNDPIQPFTFLNELTGGYLFWTSVYVSFCFILLLTMLRTKQDFRVIFVASMFPSAIIGILFAVIGLIQVEMVVMTIVILSFAGLLFNSTD